MYINERFKEINEEFDGNKNSHSFIFYTNDFANCKKDVYTLIKNINNVDNLNKISSDLQIIEKSDKNKILKEEVSNLKSFFQTTSYINKYRIYVIEEVHKLNPSSANVILKFLEEPLDGIIAFFITTNLDSVLPTIKSRCQTINVFYEINNELDNNEFDLIEKFLYNSKPYDIFNAKKLFEKYERIDLINMFEQYLNYLYKKLNEKDIIIIRKLNRAITLLNKNVNIDYVLDYLMLGSE